MTCHKRADCLFKGCGSDSGFYRFGGRGGEGKNGEPLSHLKVESQPRSCEYVFMTNTKDIKVEVSVSQVPAVESAQDVLTRLGFEPIPSRGGRVNNEMIDQIRDDDGL